MIASTEGFESQLSAPVQKGAREPGAGARGQVREGEAAGEDGAHLHHGRLFKRQSEAQAGQVRDRTGILRLFQNLWPETVFTEVDPCLQRVQGL